MTKRTLPLAALAASLVLSACGDALSAPEQRTIPVEELALVGADAPTLAVAQDPPSGITVFRFRSEEDPSSPPDPAVCAAAPFAVNVQLGGALWSEATTAAEAKVVNGKIRRVGSATACVRITDFAFTPGSRASMFARFKLSEGTVTALGDCTVASNDVPTRGLVLAGCALRVVDAPGWFGGGAVTSLSVFNPARLTGFATGSEWTVQLFDAR